MREQVFDVKGLEVGHSSRGHLEDVADSKIEGTAKEGLVVRLQEAPKLMTYRQGVTKRS